MVDAYSVTNRVDRKDQVPAKPAEKVEERKRWKTVKAGKG
jgi:hypothetical protein